MVFVVADAAELITVLEECHEELAQMTAVDDGTGFLLEEVIQGVPWHVEPGLAPYVSVETATVAGRRRHLAVTDRFPLLPPVLETGMCLPTALRPTQVAVVLAVVDQALDALGLTEGMSHTEVMLTAEGPVIIELNARVGGALPYLFPLAGGPDLFELAGACSLGRLPAPVQFRSHAVSVNLQHPVGLRVERVDGLDTISRLPGVVAVVRLTGAGRTTTSAQDSLAAVVVGSVQDTGAAVELRAACATAFRATYSGPERPDHYRRTPDGVVHDAVGGDAAR